MREGEGCRVEGSMGVIFNVESHEADTTDSRERRVISDSLRGSLTEKEETYSVPHSIRHISPVHHVSQSVDSLVS